jgi:hypothetical protein
MSHLTLEQIEECYKNNWKVDWHDQFERQIWKDGVGPLTIVGVNYINWNSIAKPANRNDVKYKNIRCGFVKYLCNDSNCRLCTDKSLILNGHFKIIRPDGFDPHGKVVYEEVGDKTIANIVDQPVFKECKSA